MRGCKLAPLVMGVCGLLTAGCAASTPSAVPKRPLSAASSMAAPSSSVADTAAPGIVFATPVEVPTDAEHIRESGVEEDTLAIATSAMTAFCRPALDYDMWISELYPSLSQRAAVAYETVDPANVPCTSLSGAATVHDGDGAFTMRILVPTDAGEYSVYVHRTTESTPWAVEQITPLTSE